MQMAIFVRLIAHNLQGLSARIKSTSRERELRVTVGQISLRTVLYAL